MAELIVRIILVIISSIITILASYIAVRTFAHFCCRTPQTAVLSKSSLSQGSKNSASGPIDNIERDTANVYTSSKSIQSIFFRNTTIACCSFFMLQIISVNIDFFIVISFPNYDIIGRMVWPSYFIGRMVLSLIFIGRLKYTFDDTPFQYTKCTINSLCFVWCLMPVCAITSTVMVVSNASHIVWMIGISIVVMFVLIDIILSCILLYIYLKKLYTLTSATKDEILKALTTKYTLLYTICYVSTVSIFVLLVIVTMVLERETSDGRLFQRIVWLLLCIDSLLNILCLWLKLSSARNVYSTLCQYFHNRCDLCCRRCTKMPQDEQMMVGTQTNSVTFPTHDAAGSSNAIEIHTAQNTAIIL